MQTVDEKPIGLLQFWCRVEVDKLETRSRANRLQFSRVLLFKFGEFDLHARKTLGFLI